MSGWRQAVFIRQRRIDVIQRALSIVLDDESWSPATPRRLRIGAADASSRGWTMIVPELANFFLERSGTHDEHAGEPRLCRLARQLHCPAYQVDVRDAATRLLEVDAHGRTRITGAPLDRISEDRAGQLASPEPGFALFSVAGDSDGKLADVDRRQPTALADYLGALAGFPSWTRHADAAITAGELVYAPPHVAARASQPLIVHTELRDAALITMPTPLPGTRAASARTSPRAGLPAHDRTGRRLRSVSRPRR